MACDPHREPRRLVLWDVDGTLVRAGDIGAAVFDLAVEAVIGRKPAARVRMSGKTDPQIVAETLEAMGIEADEEQRQAILRGVEFHLGEAADAGVLQQSGQPCPGAEDVLSALAEDPRVISGMLTGNLRPNAWAKVGAFGLDRYLDLDVGAYGSDHADRNELVPIALARLAEHAGVELKAGDTWVVGDTPRDLDCARAAGASCLLVATGRYTFDELRAAGPEVALPDLTDTARVLEILTGDL